MKITEIRTIDVGDPDVVRNVAAYYGHDVIEKDGWLNTRHDGLYIKAPTAAAQDAA